MNEFVRLLLLLALAGTVVTFFGSAAIWFMAEERRIRRAFRHVLKGPPEAMVVAHGRGRGVGFRFSTGQCAVAWDYGAWCLVYRIDELMGAELIVDGKVTARAYRDEPRRALDQVTGATIDVALRFVFDDPRHPDFELLLWEVEDGLHRNATTPSKAVQEGNRWITRAEAILRRPVPARARQEAPKVEPRPTPPPPTASAPAKEDPEDDDPPWDEDPPEEDLSDEDDALT